MKYVSLDIETTGLNPETCQIIELAAVVEDTENQVPLDELPAFQCYVKHDIYQGQPFALQLNVEIFKKLSKNEGAIVDLLRVATVFQDWVAQHIPKTPSKWTMAGKNVANFDRLFLRKLIGWRDGLWKHRTLDPVMMYWDGKGELPSTEECLSRAFIPQDTFKLHSALEDAKMVVELIRRGHKYV